MYHDGFYRVCWIAKGREVGRRSFDGLLEAKKFAKERLAVQKVRKNADSARVLDADEVIYFEFFL